MRLLLDTHAFLWWCNDDPRLSLAVVDAVADASSEVYLSAASAWEIAIKARLGRLELPSPPRDFVRRMIVRHALAVLPITLDHTLRDFELAGLHADPVDRLLVCQALAEDMTLVTNDRTIMQYGVPTLW